MNDLNMVLSKCNIFESIPADKYVNVLNCLGAKRKTFKKDQMIINIGDNHQMSGIVLSGTVEIAFFDENGNQISVNYMNAGDVFGAERACCDGYISPIQLRAVKDCEVLFLNFATLLRVTPNCCPYRFQVTVNLLRNFARQTQFLNLKLRIMGQKYLRDKVKVYFQSLQLGKDGSVTIPYNRRELAEFLYVDRSALSRELCRMRDEGILSFEGNSFKILNFDFLW